MHITLRAAPEEGPVEFLTGWCVRFRGPNGSCLDVAAYDAQSRAFGNVDWLSGAIYAHSLSATTAAVDFAVVAAIVIADDSEIRASRQLQ